MRIIIFGMKGVGKSTIARALAKRLDYTYADTDLIIEKQYNKDNNKTKLPFRQIFAKHGRAYFNKLEEKAIQEISKKDNIVISVGGSTLFNKKNYITLKTNSKVKSIFIHLTADKKTLLKRIMRRGIPPFLDDKDPKRSLSTLLKQRVPRYRELSDYMVSTTNKTVSEIISKIISKLPLNN